MHDLPNHPTLDKTKLVGECIRLKLKIDAPRLKLEVDALPLEVWGSAGGRVGVHQNAKALFLRGRAPADGNVPIEDRPVLEQLPYVRYVIEQMIGALPLRCLLARLPAATSIPVHTDLAPYFGKSLRLHIAIETNASVFMLAGNSAYQMLPGEVWVLNNSARHGVINADPARARTHLITDFLPSVPLLDLLRDGERGLGIGKVALSRRLGNAQKSTAATF